MVPCYKFDVSSMFHKDLLKSLEGEGERGDLEGERGGGRPALLQTLLKFSNILKSSEFSVHHSKVLSVLFGEKVGRSVPRLPKF